MRIRLNTKADELWIELAGEKGNVALEAGEYGRSIEIPGDHGRGAFIEIDQDGYVRMVRIAKLQDMIAEFAPQSAKSAGKGAKNT